MPCFLFKSRLDKNSSIYLKVMFYNTSTFDDLDHDTINILMCLRRLGDVGVLEILRWSDKQIDCCTSVLRVFRPEPSAKHSYDVRTKPPEKVEVHEHSRSSDRKGYRLFDSFTEDVFKFSSVMVCLILIKNARIQSLCHLFLAIVYIDARWPVLGKFQCVPSIACYWLYWCLLACSKQISVCVPSSPCYWWNWCVLACSKQISVCVPSSPCYCLYWCVRVLACSRQISVCVPSSPCYCLYWCVRVLACSRQISVCVPSSPCYCLYWCVRVLACSRQISVCVPFSPCYFLYCAC